MDLVRAHCCLRITRLRNSSHFFYILTMNRVCFIEFKRQFYTISYHVRLWHKGIVNSSMFFFIHSFTFDMAVIVVVGKCSSMTSVAVFMLLLKLISWHRYGYSNQFQWMLNGLTRIFIYIVFALKFYFFFLFIRWNMVSIGVFEHFFEVLNFRKTGS